MPGHGKNFPTRPCGPTAQPPPLTKLMALNAPASNCFQFFPSSMETSDPDGPVAIQTRRSGAHSVDP